MSRDKSVDAVTSSGFNPWVTHLSPPSPPGPIPGQPTVGRPYGKASAIEDPPGPESGMATGMTMCVTAHETLKE